MAYKEPLFIRVLPWLIGSVLFVILGLWITFGYLAFQLADEVGERGAKDVLEEVWYGKDGKLND